MEGIGRQGGTKETEKRRKFGVRIEEEEKKMKWDKNGVREIES